MVRIQDIAHYGRWFPDERDYTLWWFDREKEKMIDADELCKLFNCDVHSLNSILCDKYISISASSTLLSLRLYRSMIAVSKLITFSRGS